MSDQKPMSSGRYRLLLTLAWVVALILVPLGIILSGPFAKGLRQVGVDLHPNYRGGQPLGEHALAQWSPPGSPAGEHGPNGDLPKLMNFAVKIVSFHPLSGAGIKSRLNLIFDCTGKMSDPFRSTSGFSNVVFHVFITGLPQDTFPPSSTSPLALPVNFGDKHWQLQVIVDGFHELPQIFDGKGVMIGKGLGLYREEMKSKDDQVTNTLITAALPLSLFEKHVSDLSFFVVAGTPDLDRSSLIKLDSQGRLNEFVTLAATEKNAQTVDSSGRPKLSPLVIALP